MLLNTPLTTLFLSNFILAEEDNSTRNVPFLIKEPFGPKSNGPLRLERIDNMYSQRKDVVLNLEWQYESSAVQNDKRNQNHASLRFIFETFNHDGWVIFGLVKLLIFG